MLKIYGALLSPFVRKVRCVLTEKQIPYELVATNPFDKSGDLLKRSPLGRIPALEDEQGRSLADSTVIAEYLEERFPTPALFPRDPYERARVRWFDEYADGGMAPSLTAKVFFQRVISAKLIKGGCDEAVVQSGLKELPTFLAYLEGELDGRHHLVAETFTLADVSVACQLVNLRHAGVEIDRARFPALAAWFERIVGRPSLQALVEQDQGFLSRLSG
ncbi:MAG: glutathione S-transferase family protein [Deltaproteobacteria bacterium]|nr:glutathione S-transferase family protein [Deltaproteobacteria bacterium]